MSGDVAVFQEINGFLNSHRITKVCFIADKERPALLDTCQTNCTQIALVLSGLYEFKTTIHGQLETVSAIAGDAIFIPPLYWDSPLWHHPCRMITFSFRPRQIVITLRECRNNQSETIEQLGIPGYLKNEGKLMEDALNEMALINTVNPAAPSLTEAMIRHALHMMTVDNIIVSRAKNRWQTICLHIQENFGPNITRNSVAKMFALSWIQAISAIDCPV